MITSTRFFPTNGAAISNVNEAFNLFIISEGYQNRADFFKDVATLQTRLFQKSPFDLIEKSPNWFSIYAFFTSLAQKRTQTSYKF